MIRSASIEDAPRIAEIYNHYIKNTVITFEENSVSSEEIVVRLENVWDLGFPWLVALEGDRVVGYAYGSQWNTRSAYRFTAEISVYLSHGSLGSGIGTRLYEALFEELRKRSIRVVIAGMALPNSASQSLHERFGLKKVAHFEKIGFKFGKWLDVGYWQGKLS